MLNLPANIFSAALNPCEEILKQLGDGPLKDKVSILNALLSSDRSEHYANNNGWISDFSIIHQIHSEHLVVLKDPRLDPDLVSWLETAKNKFKNTKDPLTKISKISEYIASTFGSVGHTITSPFRNSRFEKLIQQDYVLLGQFIKNRTGVCRHRAALLQIILQDLGIKSKIKYGKYSDVRRGEPGSTPEASIEELHAWVEVEINGRIYLFDPMLEVNAKPLITIIQMEGLTDSLRIIRERKFFDDIERKYSPRSSAVMGPAQLGRDRVKDILESLK